MTYVEFFDRCATDNVCTCLVYAPDRVILIGENEDLMRCHIANYHAVFSARGYTIEFIPKRVSRTDLGEAISLLEDIVFTYSDCVFDITGGSEILNLALGVVYGRHPEIQIQRFIPRSSTVYDCDDDGNKICASAPALTVAENVKLYGGEVVYGGVSDNKTYRWDLCESFLSDVKTMWNICKNDVRAWNTQINILEAAEEEKGKGSDALFTVASISRMENYLKKKKSKYKNIVGVLGPLLRAGLITDFDDTDGVKLRVSYKNEQVKRCLTTAGMILELKVYLTALTLKDKKGQPMYDDVASGVFIDWDGRYHDEKTEKTYDTENEIDVFLMHDTVPIFISCKNGYLDSNELYKLKTVAERFGDRYAKMVLVANCIDDLGDAAGYLRQRITDMGIHLIEKVQDMSDERLAKELKNLWIKQA